MDQNNSLLADSPGKTPPYPPSVYGCYRSRIYTSNININPLIAACDQLLSLIVSSKTVELPDDNTKLLQDLAHEIRAFEHRAQIANYEQNTITAARYALCSLLDEVITATPWGQQNNWQENNLLSLFHNENYGGERFFSIIDRVLENPSINMHLIELLYLFLNFGFKGKYNEIANGQNELLAITNRLYQTIGQQSHLSPKNILIGNTKNTKLQNDIQPPKPQTSINSKKLFGLAIAVAIITSGLIYLGISLKLNSISKQIYTKIEQIQKNTSKNQI